MKKMDFKFITIVLLAALCGSMATHIVNTRLELNQEERQKKSKDFKNLTNVLIKIRSASTSGLNQKEWTDYYKDYLIAKDVYIIGNTPSSEERKILEDISKFMKQTQGYWKLSPYCLKNDQACIRKYASDSYDVIPAPEKSREEFISNLEKSLKESGKTVVEDRNETISAFITFTGIFIDSYFSFHKIDL